MFQPKRTKMPENCQNIINKNAHEHSGMHQSGRMLPALLPSSAQIDNRQTADDLLFVQKLAAQLNYYNSENILKGNWEPFFAKDLTFLLAGISLLNANTLKYDILRIQKSLKENAISTPQKKKLFDQDFQLVFNLAKHFDLIKRRFPSAHPLTSLFENLIIKLQPYFHKATAYYKAAQSRNLVSANFDPELEVFNQNLEAASDILLHYKFASAFTLDFLAQAPDDSIFGSAAETIGNQIFLGSTHHFFGDILNQFLQAYTKIIQESKLAFLDRLNKTDHRPDISLLLVFSTLMKIQRDNLNLLTGRHLDLYYKRILQLGLKAPESSFVHVTFELVKLVGTYALPAKTLLKAGKDSRGNEVLYQTDRETLISEVKISDLKCLYRANTVDDTNKVLGFDKKLEGRVFAGNFLGTHAKSSSPFVAKQFKNGQLAAIDTEEAQIGFAIASNYLFLREGQREISLSISLQSTPSISLVHPLKEHFSAYISTEKAWESISISDATLLANQLTIKFLMTEKQDSTAPYNSSIHGHQFVSPNPILKILLNHLPGDPYLHGLLYDYTINQIDLSVNVTNVRQLYLQSDFGLLDVSKPFLPFGISPKKNNGMVIGNSEIFQKRSFVKFKWLWKETDESNLNSEQNALALTQANLAAVNFKLKTYQNGNWANASLNADEFEVKNEDLVPGQYGDNRPFDSESKSGFVKIEYRGAYESRFNEHLKNLAQNLGKTTPTTPPNAPGAPTAISFTADYRASVSLDLNNVLTFENREANFFHIFPFGEIERHRKLEANDVPLFPEFRRNNYADPFFVLKNEEASYLNDVSGLNPQDDFSGFAEHEGEYYLGLENLKIPGAISMLLQFEEGTSDPKTAKPEQHIHWSYLSQYGWKSIPKREFSDSTGQWTNSGIVTINIPSDASSENPILPLGKIWLRASITKGNLAVCKLKTILPNAVLAKMMDANHHEDLLLKPLAADTISKLYDPLAVIKKVKQPFEGFGGREGESSNAFYTRISERLRHKDRAVMAFDYERLILEKFPKIHKVKCLNHTRYEFSSSNTLIYNELAAGHVSIITIPDLRFNSQINPLEPYTALGTLEDIKQYILQKKPAFAQLHVCNPIFEKIRMSFDLALHPGFDVSYYSKVLQESITAFLSPWAYATDTQLTFGGRIEKSVLIDFIEEQAYVDFLENVKLYHEYPNENGIFIETEVEYAIASTQASVLVSAPAEQHLINEINTTFLVEESHTCGC